MIEDKFEQRTLYTARGEMYKTLDCKKYEPIPLMNMCSTGYNTILTKQPYGKIPILQSGGPYERYPILKSGAYDRYSITQISGANSGYLGNRNVAAGYPSSKAA